MDTTTRRSPSFDRGGDRNYDRLAPAEKDAVDFINWATERGARDGGPTSTWAAHAARHLRSTAPERFVKAVASWKAGRAEDVYAGLVALAAEAAR